MPASFGVISGRSVSETWDPTDTQGQRHELGTILASKNGDQWSLVQCVQLDNSGCSQGEALVMNLATLKQYSVSKAATTDEGAPPAGIAAATIASQRCGWMYIAGYVEKADLSHTAASGEYLTISGSTAGKLSPDAASCFNLGTQGNASAFVVCGRARTAIATGVGSISICGVWGA